VAKDCEHRFCINFTRDWRVENQSAERAPILAQTETKKNVVLFGTLAMFAGDMANNYVLAKMKVWTNGRYISARFVSSTPCGQIVNTAVFCIFSLWG
jgi:uncharacterized PurR-regulated membrane protein YhhQ (DUF165 family)